MNYRTRQGEALLNYLRSVDGRHVSVAQIAAGLSGSVGVTTIYRQLDRLIDRGLVRKSSADGEAACYQYVGGQCRNHFHLICTECRKLIHLECGEFDRLCEHIHAEHGFLPDPMRTSVYGLCADCLKKAGK